MSTRFFSNRQEKKIAKRLGGRQTANSGATNFLKGDVSLGNWLLECKTCMKDKDSFSIKKEWLLKLKEERYAMNKEHCALAFNFGPDQENFYIVDERLFKNIVETLKEVEGK